jgi:carnitine 3-dehydrogenase
MTSITQATIVGAGVIGAGWAARLIENGIHVRIYDPSPAARGALEAVLENSRHAYERLTTAPRNAEGACVFSSSLAEGVEAAEWIVESVPERPELKQSVLAEIEHAATPTAMITSSTSGILPSTLQAGMQHPDRFLVAHPFNPVYLLPLVEIVAGRDTGPQVVESARELFESIGMHPLLVRKEIDGFIADRLLEAMWREALWLVKDGIASTAEIDDAVRFGFGLRFAQMGLFETYRIAGGEGGMRQFIEQFGPCLEWPWTKLTDVPELTEEFVDRLVEQSDEQSGHKTIRELERIRDDNLIAILRALRASDRGAGQTLARHERRLEHANRRLTKR